MTMALNMEESDLQGKEVFNSIPESNWYALAVDPDYSHAKGKLSFCVVPCLSEEAAQEAGKFLFFVMGFKTPITIDYMPTEQEGILYYTPPSVYPEMLENTKEQLAKIEVVKMEVKTKDDLTAIELMNELNRF